MTTSRSRLLATLAAVALAAVPFASATAQSYPSKPIRLIVPLAAGSRTHDIIKLPDEAAASRAAPVRKVA